MKTKSPQYTPKSSHKKNVEQNNVYTFKKTKNWKVENEMFNRDNLTCSAKGMLCKFLSLPPTFRVESTTLHLMFQEGRDACRTIWNELREKGYIQKIEYKENNLIRTQFNIFEDGRKTPSDVLLLRQRVRNKKKKSKNLPQKLYFQDVDYKRDAGGRFAKLKNNLCKRVEKSQVVDNQLGCGQRVAKFKNKKHENLALKSRSQVIDNERHYGQRVAKLKNNPGQRVAKYTNKKHENLSPKTHSQVIDNERHYGQRVAQCKNDDPLYISSSIINNKYKKEYTTTPLPPYPVKRDPEKKPPGSEKNSESSSSSIFIEKYGESEHKRLKNFLDKESYIHAMEYSTTCKVEVRTAYGFYRNVALNKKQFPLPKNTSNHLENDKRWLAERIPSLPKNIKMEVHKDYVEIYERKNSFDISAGMVSMNTPNFRENIFFRLKKMAQARQYEKKLKKSVS